MSGQREATELPLVEALGSMSALAPALRARGLGYSADAVDFMAAAVERVLDLCDEWAYEGNTMITRSHAVTVRAALLGES